MLFFFLIYFQPNARGKQQQQLATFNVIAFITCVRKSVFFRPSLLVGTSILFLIHPPSSIEISENILKKNWKNFLVIQSSVIHFEWLLHCLIPSFFPETFPTLFLLAIRIISILLFSLLSFSCERCCSLRYLVFLFAAKSDISCKLVATNKHSLPQPPTSTTSASKSCSGNNSQEPTALATLQFLYIINDDTPYTDTRDTYSCCCCSFERNPS